MFERYTEKARRAIFFGRYEASVAGSPYIQPEHVLIGMLRDSPEAVSGYLTLDTSDLESRLRNTLVAGEPTKTTVHPRLDKDCKRALAYAAEESDKMRHRQIRPEHLLLGLMREEKNKAGRLLREMGAPDLAEVRKRVSESPAYEPQPKLDAIQPWAAVSMTNPNPARRAGTNRRPIYFVIALATLTVGLLWRFVFVSLPPFLYKYGGSMLWAAMIYWIAALLSPQTRTLKLAVVCGVIATAVEFFKLVHTPALDAFRLTFVGKVLIGRFFYWSGILAYWIAIGAAARADFALRRSVD